MRSLIITNLPIIFSEKDLFLLLFTLTQGIKRVIVADNPMNVSQSLKTATVIYSTFEEAQSAFHIIQNSEIMESKVDVAWKDPEFDPVF
jgi:RNA recognition motif-containing protein